VASISCAVAEASRLFFGKDVSNVSLAEAATIAGVFQSPSALSPFTNPDRCKEKRNVVLQAMVDAGYVNHDVAEPIVPDGCVEIVFNLADPFMHVSTDGSVTRQPASRAVSRNSLPLCSLAMQTM